MTIGKGKNTMNNYCCSLCEKIRNIEVGDRIRHETFGGICLETAVDVLDDHVNVVSMEKPGGTKYRVDFSRIIDVIKQKKKYTVIYQEDNICRSVACAYLEEDNIEEEISKLRRYYDVSYIFDGPCKQAEGII